MKMKLYSFDTPPEEGPFAVYFTKKRMSTFDNMQDFENTKSDFIDDDEEVLGWMPIHVNHHIHGPPMPPMTTKN